METFNILGKSIAFDEDFLKYLNINAHKLKLCDEYTTKYNSLNTYVKNLDELYVYMNNLSEFMKNTFINSADEVLNMLTTYQIFDKSLSEILSNCRWATSYFKNIEEVSQGIQEFLKKEEENIQEQALELANTVEYTQLNVWSSSGWNLFVADLINMGEERRAEKKQERIYKFAVNRQLKAYTKVNNEYATSQQKTLQEKAFIFGISAINEMFDYCIEILISNGKLSLDIKEHLQKEKAENILNNIQRCQDKNIKQEQLIIAFQADPFSSEVHSKILDYINDDIEEYIKLVKFIKCENIVLQICQIKSTDFNNENDKYVRVINLLDEQYIKNVISKSNTIEDIENRDPNINLSISKKNFYMEYKKVFNVFLYASNKVGKIQEQDITNGHILVKCSILNPTTIDIKIHKQNPNQTIVEISSLCKSDSGISQSPKKWKEKLFEEIYNKLNNNDENVNANNSNENIENINVQNEKEEENVKNINVHNSNGNTTINASNSIFENNSNIITKIYDMDFDKIYDIFFCEAYLLSKKRLKLQDKKNGHIVVMCPITIVSVVTIDIQLTKINENQTEVTIKLLDSGLFNKLDVKCQNKLIENVEKKIAEKTNNIS